MNVGVIQEAFVVWFHGFTELREKLGCERSKCDEVYNCNHLIQTTSNLLAKIKRQELLCESCSEQLSHLDFLEAQK